ncbi:MAG: hypothetical protein R2851_21145 [Caldilineaceae bacterium]
MHAETVSVPPTTSEESHVGLPARLASAAWRVATSSVLLLTVAAATLAMVLLALWLPQMPNNLQSNPAAATRWLMGMAANFGSPGAPLRTLGLFNLLHSPIFVLALALLAFLLAVQLARQVGIVLALRQMPAIAAAPPATRAPLVLPPMLDVFRRRTQVADSATNLADDVAAGLTERWGTVAREDLAATPADADDAPSPDPAPDRGEIRLFAARHLPWAWLRPVMVTGLLLSVLTLWLNSAFGWEVIPDTLPPGGTYRYPPRALELSYVLDEAGATLAAGLKARLGASELIVPIEPESAHEVGRALLLTRVQSPGLVVQTEPDRMRMGVPGEPANDGAIGFSFPEAGSEQSLLLPDASMGVRLVRLPPDESMRNPYMIELYDAGQATAAQREIVDVTEPRVIQVDEADFQFKLTPAPTVDAIVRYQPLAWLAWVGLALTVLGLPGFLVRPGFVLVQLAPLDQGRTQLIVQSNQQHAVEQVAVPAAEQAASPAADIAAGARA